jgi:hypothetical protein
VIAENSSHVIIFLVRAEAHEENTSLCAGVPCAAVHVRQCSPHGNVGRKGRNGVFTRDRNGAAVHVSDVLIA